MARVLEWAQRQHEDRQQGQFSLFGNSAAGASLDTPGLEPVTAWSDSEQLAYEKEALGFYISSHPLMAVQQQMRRLVTATSQSLADCQGEQTVTIGGLITQHRAQLTKNGDRMAFLTLEDLYGSLEVIVFPDTYRQSVSACESEEPVVVWGKAKAEGEAGEIRILAQRILLLKDAMALGEFRRLTLVVAPPHDCSTLLHVHDLLAQAPGTCQVVLALQFPDGERVLLRAAERLNVAPSVALLAELEELLGAENVRVA
jgi:DNA polymerase-3 subunit alpha